jgi:hypothetical protein
MHAPDVITSLTSNSDVRKNLPVVTGVLDYFPLAIAYVALVSKIGNDKHNPGQPLHWSRHQSADHIDCAGRHMLERGEWAEDNGVLHDGMLAWRALANLQLVLEEKRAQGFDIFAPYGGRTRDRGDGAALTASVTDPKSFDHLCRRCFRVHDPKVSCLLPEQPPYVTNIGSHSG